MKMTLVLLCALCCSAIAFSQGTETTGQQEQSLEALAEKEDVEEGEELVPEELIKYLKHPLNLNNAQAEDLLELNILTPLQATSLLLYRKVFGDLIDLRELQAVPGLPVTIIKKMLPYVTVADDGSLHLKSSFREGEQTITLRYGTTLESSRGFKENIYLGSAARYGLRYKYEHKKMRWGYTAEKDAGEIFTLRKKQAGFDFQSFHFVLRKTGTIETLVVGDFTVNMGQGLIQWQSLALKKSATVLNIKRQSAAIRPYTSSGEHNFYRGVGITLRRNHWVTTFFSSYRTVDGHLETDPVARESSVSSILTSGNHRTINENRDKKNLGWFSTGMVQGIYYSRWHIAVNGVYHRYGYPILKKDAPYHFFAVRGNRFANGSVDYSYTFKNLHFFGETAVSQLPAIATINALLLAINARVDMSFSYRRISMRYQAITGNAFTENAVPNNEEGLYLGLSIRPVGTLAIDSYMDLFHFRWLKYQVNAASGGKDLLLAISYKPNRQVEFSTRWKYTSAMKNSPGNAIAIDQVQKQVRQNLRLHANLTVSREWVIQHRFEFVVLKTEARENQEGVMMFTDAAYKPSGRRWSARCRLQFFSTDGYETRIYSYESGVPGVFSIPAIYGNGKRYLLALNRKVAIKGSHWQLVCSLVGSRTQYINLSSIGSGFDEIQGNHRSQVSVQVVFSRN